jgi:hypothetical protein
MVPGSNDISWANIENYRVHVTAVCPRFVWARRFGLQLFPDFHAEVAELLNAHW